MDIIPVLDLLHGRVVRGVAGERHRYRALSSDLAATPDASVVFNSLRQTFGFHRFYIADLDAIQFQTLNRCILAELAEPDVSLMVDRGVRNSGDVEELLDLGVADVVVALETLPDAGSAAMLLRQFGSERLVLSLDLRDGELNTACEEWRESSPLLVAEQLHQIGFRRFIVLDVAAVGTGQGPPTVPLCESLRRTLAGVTLMTGGGIRGMDDLETLRASGIDAALVASALHDGRLTAEQVRTF
ncbi:MAG: HisA/HisF-related TIM barrel protein [Planctomycetaceae bacterium]